MKFSFLGISLQVPFTGEGQACLALRHFDHRLSLEESMPTLGHGSLLGAFLLMLMPKLILKSLLRPLTQFQRVASLGILFGVEATNAGLS